MRTVVSLLLVVTLIAGCSGGGSDPSDTAVPITTPAVPTTTTAVPTNLIAFVSERYGDKEILVMNADGTDVYSTGQKGYSPRWGG